MTQQALDTARRQDAQDDWAVQERIKAIANVIVFPSNEACSSATGMTYRQWLLGKAIEGGATHSWSSHVARNAIALVDSVIEHLAREE